MATASKMHASKNYFEDAGCNQIPNTHKTIAMERKAKKMHTKNMMKAKKMGKNNK